MSTGILELEFHEVASIFPMMGETELQALADDIAENGLREPICVDADNRIVDGRNRYLACKRIGAEMFFCDAPTDGSLIAFVVSLNLRRRHLTKSQMAVVALDMLPHLEAEAKERQGTRTDIRQKIDEGAGRSDEKAGELLGVNRQYVADAKSIAVEDPELLEEVRAGEKTITEAKRELKDRERAAKRAENAELVAQAQDPAALEGVYSTILIDPPWDATEEGDNSVMGRSRPVYAAMSDDNIAALPVGDLASENAHLYLWITNRSLLTGKGWRLCEAWGFRPITVVTWWKPSIGMGNYFRNDTEHIVFGVKGSMELERQDMGTCFQAPRGPHGHSSKPVAAYEIVESCSPGPYLEMFARSQRDGWVSWGADA